LTVTSGTVLSGGLLVNGGSVVLPTGSIQNSELENSSITVSATAGTGLSVSGSPVSLGGTLTVSGIDASTSVKGVASFNSTNFSVSSGAVNTIQDIATTSSPTFVGLSLSSGNLGIGTSATGSKLAVNGNGIIGWGTTSIAGPTNGLAVFGNVGVGTTSPTYKLDVVGQVNGSTGLCIAGDCKSSWTGVGGYTASNGITLSSTDFQLGGSLTRATGIDINSQNFGFLGGNVGIGTSSPTGVFQVGNTTTTPAFYVSSLTGNVGIGTTSSTYNLQIFRSRSAADNSVLALGLDSGGSAGQTNDLVRLSFTAVGNSGVQRTSAQIVGVTELSTGFNGALAFYTTSSSTTTTEKMRITSAGNIGIGTTTPGSKFAVIGNGTIGFGNSATSPAGPANGLGISGNLGIGATTANSNLSVVGNAHIGSLYQGIAAPANGLFVDGNVGIGATTSSNKLDVWGNARVTGTLTVDGTLSTGSLSAPNFLAGNGSASAPAYSFTNLTNAGLWTNGDGLLLITGGSNTSGITVTGAGNVGIGTTSPGTKLQVDGAITAASGSTGGFIAGTGSKYTTLYTNSSNHGVLQTTDGDLLFSPAGDSNFLVGNVGIGTSATGAKLQVNGNGIFWPSTTALTGPTNGLAVFGNVGVGTTSPNYKLDVVGQVNGSTGLCIAGDCKSSWTGVGGYTASNGITLSSQDFQLGGSLTRATGIDIAGQNFGFLGGNVGIGLTNSTGLFQVATPTYQAIFVNTSGNVGIGTTNPISKLSVIGGIRTDTNFILTGAGTIGTGTTSDDLRMYGVDDLELGTNSGGVNLFLQSDGNVGIGTTTPGSKFSVSGNATIGFGGATSIVGPANGLGISGNLGIGTTTANSNLSVVGNAHIGSLYQGISAPANGLFVDGNVGIGATTSSNKLDVWGGANITGNLGIGQSLTVGSNLTLSGYSCSGLGNGGKLTTDASGNVICSADGGSGTTYTASNGITLSGADFQLGGTLAATTKININSQSFGFFGGNVGIGTTSPLAPLQVQGNGTNSAFFLNGNVGIGTTEGVYKLDVNGDVNIAAGSNYKINGVNQAFDKWTAGTGNDIYRSTGNVGIGTTGPGALFTVGNNLFQINSSGYALLPLGLVGSPALSFVGDPDTGLWSALANTLNFSTGGVVRATIDSNGNLGIGTSLPMAALDVAGATSTIANSSGNMTITSAGNLFISLSGGNVGIGTSAVAGAALQVNGGGVFGWGTTSVAAPANGLTVNGNVGIGTSLPSQALDVVGEFMLVSTDKADATAKGGRFGVKHYTNSEEPLTGMVLSSLVSTSIVNIGGGSTSGNAATEIRFLTAANNTTTAGTQRMTIDSGGNVGIGDAAPTEANLVVGDAGAGNIYATFATANTETLCWDASGASLITDCTSLRQFKENIQDLSLSGLATVMQLKPREYDWIGKETGIRHDLGFVAEEMEEINPLLASYNYDKDGVLKLNGVKYERLTALLTKAIQEQQGQITGLQSSVLSLQTNQATTSALLANLSLDGSGNLTQTGSLNVTGNIGIGTSNPTARLQVSGDSGQLFNVSTTTSNLFTVNSSGNVGIGTSNPQFTLEVNGTGKLNDAAWTYASDKRLKENIASVSAGLSIIEQLNPVTFDYINGGKNRAGFIAQEVQSILPNLVSTGSDGMLGVRLEELLPYAVKAIQEQQKQINGLLAQQATNSGMLTGLSVNTDGTLNAPEMKTNKLVILADVNFAASPLASLLSSLSTTNPSTSLGADSELRTPNSNEVDLLSSLNAISAAVLGIQTQESTASAELASLESRAESQESKMANLQAQIASLSATLSSWRESSTDRISTASATLDSIASPSATLQNDSTASAQIATNSAQVTGDSGQQTATSSAFVSNCTLYPENCTLNLTPPSILLATTSAQLVNLEVTSDATISGQLTAYDLNIQNGLKSLGTTTLGSTLIAGDLSVDGTLSLTGSSISTLGNLSIQNGSLAGPVDFFNGAVTIDNNGSLVAQTVSANNVVTNKLTISNTEIASSSATPRNDVIASAAKQSNSIGSDKIPTGQVKAAILTTAITPTSKVFITPKSSTQGQTPYVELAEPEVGFVVSIDNAIGRDIDFDWWIVDTK